MNSLFETYGKRVGIIILFYVINFGLWEIIAPAVSGEWASFVVYVLLFVIVVLLFCKEIREAWLDIVSIQLKNKRFYMKWLIFLAIDLALTIVVVLLASKYFPAIMPVNNENVKAQLDSVPILLGVIQGCVFAPVIEETVFRYSIIGKPESKSKLVILTISSIVMFDCIHIVAPLEFFYYLVPAIILTLFYNWNKNIIASMLLHSSINVIGYVALLSGLL